MTKVRVRRAVTSRSGGVSAPPYATFNLSERVGDAPAAVAGNRARLASLVGVPSAALVWAGSVHGAGVAVVGPGSVPSSPVEGVDGLVTDRADVAIAVLAADCVPLLAADPEAGVVGVAHAGRRGAAAGIGDALVAAMVGLGAEPGRLDVLLGPAICGGCYEVPDGLRAEVEAALPGSASATRWGTAGLDLRAGLAGQLRRAGVASVTVDPRCTYEDVDLFSFRRDGVTGRQAGVAWLGAVDADG